MQKVRLTASVASEKKSYSFKSGSHFRAFLNGIVSMFLNDFLQKSDLTFYKRFKRFSCSDQREIREDNGIMQCHQWHQLCSTCFRLWKIVNEMRKVRLIVSVASEKNQLFSSQPHFRSFLNRRMLMFRNDFLQKYDLTFYKRFKRFSCGDQR